MSLSGKETAPYPKNDSAVEREGLGAHLKPQTVAVIVLAGGYGERLVSDVLEDQAVARDKQTNTHSNMHLLQGSVGHLRANHGMLLCNGLPVLMHWLRSLARCERLAPLDQNIYFVVNEVDILSFSGEGGLLQRLADEGGYIPASNVISNGSSTAEGWRGHVADLQLALQRIGSQRHVTAFSPSFTIPPGYNLQRVIEHSFVRNCDTLAYVKLEEPEWRLTAGHGYTALAAEQEHQLPRLTTIATGQSAQVGDMIGESLMVLRKSSLGLVASSNARDLQGLAAELLHRHGLPVAGVDLQIRFRVDSLPLLDYATRYQSHHYGKQVKGPPEPGAHEMILGDDVTDLGTMMMTKRSGYMEQFTAEQSLQDTSNFNTAYFAQREGAQGAPGMPFYRLPPMFYKSQNQRVYGAVTQ